MDEKPSDQQPKASPGCAILVLKMLGWSALGFIFGGVSGLFVFPELCRLALAPNYEIQPWDGQHIGEAVGVLVGLFVFLKRNQTVPLSK